MGRAPPAVDIARRLLTHLRRKGSLSAFQIPRDSGVTIGSYRIAGLGTLQILSIPSVFPPEDWGRVFVTGLLHRSREYFRGKTVIELGAGSGWISVALARFTPLRRVIAVDINPHARLVTEINTLLNGVHGKVEAAISNLFAAIHPVRAHHIIGNIPQVIAPPFKPRDDEALRALADYTEPRGSMEDLFSLGLVAAALESSLPYLADQGTVILNLAGRPGYDVLRWLFARWGFDPRIIHRERVQQDAMTSIQALVDAERLTGRRFRFYDMLTGSHPISAREAQKRMQAGAPVWHDLFVVEARPYRSFLPREATVGLRRIPYTPEAGSELSELRHEICRYLRGYLKLDVLPDEIFIAPSRAALERLLRTARPNIEILSVPDAARRLRAGWVPVRARARKGLVALDETRAPVLSRLLRRPDPAAEILASHRDRIVFLYDLGARLRVPLGISIAVSRRLFPALQAAADAGYARAPTLEQRQLLVLLRRLNRNYRGSFDEHGPPAEPIRAIAIQNDPGLAPGVHREGDDYIRLDFGESEFPIPAEARGAGPDSLERAAAAGERYFRESRGLNPKRVVVGPGIQPLIEAALRALGEKRVILPVPYFGPFHALIRVVGAEPVRAMTRRVGRELEIHLPSGGGVLLLSNPNNPTGLYYSDKAVREMSGFTVLADEAFGLLGEGRRTLPAAVTFAGLSKEFALGGLRVGFAACDDPGLAERIERHLTHRPDPWSLGVAVAVLPHWQEIIDRHMNEYLLPRRKRLEKTLRDMGIPFVPPAGGFFIWADFVTAWRGRKWDGKDFLGQRVSRPVKVSRENIRQIVYDATKISVNSPEWSGLWPGPCRVVYAVDRLPEACSRLSDFARRLR